MKRLLLACLSCISLVAGVALFAAPAADDAELPIAPVVLLKIDGAVSPASADYVQRGIADANAEGANAIILQMDTPGGLDKSMRTIIKAILASNVPVIGFVAPSGSRAASAGTYILYACHIAAMAPGTNIGAATPVQLIGPGQPAKPANLPTPDKLPAAADDKGKPPTDAQPADAEGRKVLNDAIAYIQALAEQRGRNADWAEKAVRDAVSISAQEALKLDVIDLIAADVTSLLKEVDGRKVTTASGEHTLHTRDAVVTASEPDWRSRFLAVIADPSIAYLLLLFGIGGLLFEGYSPGAVLPGVVGAICLLLALYALQMLPVNYAGLALIALGVSLLIAESMIPAYGALGIGVPGYGISLPLLIGISLAAVLILAAIIWLALRSHNRPVVSGREQMVGATGIAVGDFDHTGSVHVHGERWQARTRTPLRTDQPIRVAAMDGLILIVEPLSAPPEGEK